MNRQARAVPASVREQDVGAHVRRSERAVPNGAGLTYDAGPQPATTAGRPGHESGPLVWRILLVVLALGSSGALLWASRWGLGLRSDSAVYVAAARNLVAGDGLSWISGGGEIRPLTLHAPLLSLLLAGAHALGFDVLEAARVLNVVCLGLEVVLVGLLANRLTGSTAFGLLAALVMAGTGEMLKVHVWLMSEPLFIVLTLAGLLALLRYGEDRNRPWLGASALAFGLAALTRYGGLALPAAGALFLVVKPDIPWRRRLGDAAVMLAVGLSPPAAWMARNLILTGQTGGRTFGVHLELWPTLRDQALAIVLNWYAPLRLVDWVASREWLSSFLVGLGSLTLVTLGAMLFNRRVRRAFAASPQLSGVLLVTLCLLSYLGITFFAALFSSPGADVDERVLSPVYPLLWLVLVAGLAWVWSRRRIALRVLAGLLLVVLVRNKLVYAYWTIRELSADGLGYASRAWHPSATIQQVESLNPGVIYTNDIAAIYLLADRSSYLVPWALSDYDPNAALQVEAELGRELAERDGALVLFGAGSLPEGWPGIAFRVAYSTPDGVILLAAEGRSD